jgi:tetratricopeptide (TPR) repeat protein
MKPLQNAFQVWGVALAGVKGLLALSPLRASFFLLFFSSSVLLAQTRFEPEDSAVLFRLDSQFNKADGLRQAMEAWRANPQDISTATSAAKTAFLAASRHGDLRWLGTAKAMLDPWWVKPDLPSDTFFVRALVRQGMHDFGGALNDLNAAISADANQSQFWAWRFAVYMVRSEIAKASGECQAIGERFGAAEQESCSAVLLYRTGKPELAIKKFNELARHPDYQGENAQEWLAFNQGEARRVAGDVQAANKVWQSYLKQGRAAHGIQVALIDSLINVGDFASALRLNMGPQRSDALLVSAIQAAQALNNGQDAVLRADIEQRLMQRELRGESLNERPFVKYYLYVRQDPRKALEMATESWKTEREPADALLFAQAALRSGEPLQAISLLQWQMETGYREPELDRLLGQIKNATVSKGKQ